MNRAFSVIRSPRAGVALLLMSVGWVVSAQQTAAPRPPTPVTTNFTGSVANLNATDVSAVRFRYAAGARSYWHSHAGIQVLTLEEGRGRAQIQNQMMQELLPGRPVLLPAGVPHWHGAAPDQGLVQIATKLGGATWMGPVSDEEYMGKK